MSVALHEARRMPWVNPKELAWKTTVNHLLWMLWTELRFPESTAQTPLTHLDFISKYKDPSLYYNPKWTLFEVKVSSLLFFLLVVILYIYKALIRNQCKKERGERDRIALNGLLVAKAEREKMTRTVVKDKHLTYITVSWWRENLWKTEVSVLLFAFFQGCIMGCNWSLVRENWNTFLTLGKKNQCEQANRWGLKLTMDINILFLLDELWPLSSVNFAKTQTNTIILLVSLHIAPQNSKAIEKKMGLKGDIEEMHGKLFS